MKIAICISGQLRWSYKDSLASLKKNIVTPNNCDVFLQTYDSPYLKKALTIINPKEALIEKPVKDFSIPEHCYQVKAPETNIENMYWMWRNVKKSIDMVTPEYDCIIRTRPDLIHPASIVIQENFYKKMLIPKGGDWRDGIFDMLAISSFSNMHYYSKVFEEMGKYMKQGVMGHPENLLKHHLKQKYPDIEVHRFPYNLYLSREQAGAKYYILANHEDDEIEAPARIFY